jgi:hypothetical protein
MTKFWVYTLTADTLCLGERTKKGTYRASIESCIPYSQITGALRALYGGGGHEFDLHAVGVLRFFRKQSITQGLRDRLTGISVLPIEADILVDVQGQVYVVYNDYTANLPERIELRMGAFRSKGIGDCVLDRPAARPPLEVTETQVGRLGVRLPDDADILRLFGIEEVLMPVWGYLFRPDERHISGQYVRALFEGSIVRGPKIFLQSEKGGKR